MAGDLQYIGIRRDHTVVPFTGLIDSTVRQLNNFKMGICTSHNRRTMLLLLFAIQRRKSHFEQRTAGKLCVFRSECCQLSYIPCTRVAPKTGPPLVLFSREDKLDSIKITSDVQRSAQRKYIGLTDP